MSHTPEPLFPSSETEKVIINTRCSDYSRLQVAFNGLSRHKSSHPNWKDTISFRNPLRVRRFIPRFH